MASAAVAEDRPLRTLALTVRRRIGTTPGRLRFAGGLLVMASVVFGVVTAGGAAVRHSAAHSAATASEPLLVHVENFYSSLADADATAASTFATGGAEPAARRARYLRDLRSASADLAAMSHRLEMSGQAFAPLRTVTTQLPVYAGLIETARANNRQGFPIGAAYLRQASTLMRDEILPAAGQLYGLEARHLNSDYRAGASTGPIVALVVTAVVLLALLVSTQFYLARATKRIFNIGLLAGTVLVIILSFWVGNAFVSEQNALSSAQRSGSDSVLVLSTARILASRAQSDEGLALIARGGGDQNLADFAVQVKALGGTDAQGGLLREAKAISRRSGSTAVVDALSVRLAAYLAAHRRVAAHEADGDFAGAARVAVGKRSKEISAADAMASTFARTIDAAQADFTRAASEAESALNGLAIGIPILVTALVLLVLYGLRQRINEYR
jgi:hypothetical protein